MTDPILSTQDIVVRFGVLQTEFDADAAVGGEDAVADRPEHWDRLTGDRGLIDVGTAVDDGALAGNALSGSDNHDIAASKIRGVDSMLDARGIELHGGLGREIEETANRVGRTASQDRLECAGGGEDDDEQCAVEDLPDRCCAEGRDDHQQVDVEGLLSQCA